MCEPSTALMAASLIASGVSAYSQYQSGKYSAAIANQNADIAEAQANDAINRGNLEAEQRRREVRQRQGAQAAAMGATGGDLSSGSSLDIFGDTAQFGALDVLTTVNNAQREAYGYQVQTANYKAEAKSARRQGDMGAFSTLLTAPLQAYGAYKMAGGAWTPFKQSTAAPITNFPGTMKV